MTTIWRWEFSEDFAVFEYVGPPPGPRAAMEAGAADWVAPQLSNVARSRRKRKPLGDFPGTTEFLHLISPRAADLMGATLRSCGLLLPANVADVPGEWALFEPTRIVPCLDLEKSKLLRLPWPPHRIASVITPAFEDEKLPDGGIFVVSQCPLGEIYVCDDVVREVERCGLEGFAVTRVA